MVAMLGNFMLGISFGMTSTALLLLALLIIVLCLIGLGVLAANHIRAHYR